MPSGNQSSPGYPVLGMASPFYRGTIPPWHPIHPKRRRFRVVSHLRRMSLIWRMSSGGRAILNLAITVVYELSADLRESNVDLQESADLRESTADLRKRNMPSDTQNFCIIAMPQNYRDTTLNTQHHYLHCSDSGIAPTSIRRDAHVRNQRFQQERYPRHDHGQHRGKV